MKQLISIKRFEFDTAQYRLSDGGGDQVTLQVDYKNNRFHILGSSPVANPAFRAEIAEIAADLLGRKHGVNFADR